MTAVEWLEVFVEEPSMAAALQVLIPKIRPEIKDSFQIHAFDGVHDLLEQLPGRLKGYAGGWMPASWRIVIVRDEDRQSCTKLKSDLEAIVRKAGLVPKGKRTARYQVLTRIAIEELEAWLLGDVPALAATYTGVPLTLANQKAYRDVDAIKGGTWEALERALQRAGHFLGGLAKIQVAREVAVNMDADGNSSKSFQVFRDGIRGL